MNVKDLVAGVAVTLVIGGTAFTVSQTDVIDNFAEDTGMSQQQAEEYVKGVDDSDLVAFSELGDDHIEEGEEISRVAAGMDCVNYEYEWETPSLSCQTGKAQLSQIGQTLVDLGRSYKKLDSESASELDMRNTIRLLDELNAAYDSDIVASAISASEVTESKRINSYNKSLLKAALESN